MERNILCGYGFMNSSRTKELCADHLESLVFDVLLNQMREKRLRTHALCRTKFFFELSNFCLHNNRPLYSSFLCINPAMAEENIPRVLLML